MNSRHQHFIALGIALCLVGFPLSTNAQCTPVDFCGAATIMVESTGYNIDPAYANWFVLLDQSTELIVAASTTGDFTADVVDGQTYQVHSLNFKVSEPPSVMASLDPLDLEGLDLLSLNDGCYDPNFQNEFICFTYHNDCLCDGIDLTLSDPLPNSAHAEVSLTASGTVSAGSEVTLKAGQYLQFTPGFVAENNSTFNVIIEDCTSF